MVRSFPGLARSLSRKSAPARASGRSRQASSPYELLEPRTLLTAWYVSPSGADTDRGTLEQPFRTIQRAAVLAQPGDTVLIRGGIYRETVTPALSGRAGAPITFQPYNGEQVTVSGADVVAGWAPHDATGIHRAGMNWTRGVGEDQVFVDGQMMIHARWPNTTLDVSRPTKIAADGGSSTTVAGVTTGQVTDAELTQAAAYWTGATVHIAAGAGFVQHTGTVTASAPGSLTFTYSASNDSLPQAGNQFYIDNTFKALDAPGEWYRDPTTATLYLRTSQSDTPTGHVVEAKRRDLAFDLRGKAYVNVNGLNLFAATITSDAASNHLTIDGIRAKYVSHYSAVPYNAWVFAASDTGIVLNGSFNEIRNSEIAFSAGNGVMLGGTDNKAVNNVIHDVNYGATDAAGISTGAPADTTRRLEIANNTVYNAGRSLIVFRNLKAGNIHHNDVYSAGLQTNDLGGLYTHGLDGEGTVIAYNEVHDIYSAVAGVGGFGIYFDNATSNFVTHHNLVYNAGTALLINTPGVNHTVYNNTLMGGKAVSSWPAGPLVNTVLKNNIYGGPVEIDPGTLQQNNLASGTDPMFVNASSFDFRPQAVSPAIDAGQALAPYTNGYVGAAPDVGAFEYGVPAWETGPVGSNVPPAPPLPPTGLVGTATSDTQVSLTWLDNTTAEQGFTIERSADGSLYSVIGVVGSNVTRFTDRLVSPTTRYIYRIRADNSPYSNAAVVVTKRGATSVIQAEWVDASQGVHNDSFALGSLDHNDWAMYRGVNFGSGVSQVGIRIGVPNELAGKKIEVRVDGVSGPLLGTLTVAGTGGWAQVTTQWAPVTTAVTGWHDVYLVFKGGWGVGYLDSFLFKRAASAPLQAEGFDDMEGVARDAGGIGSLDHGDWSRYGNVDFGSGNLNMFVARIGVPAELAGKQIEVRVGRPTGPLAASLTVAATGGFGALADQSAAMTTPLTGVQDVYLVVKGGWGVGNLDWLTFKQQASPAAPAIQAESYTAMLGVANDGAAIGSLDPGDWARYDNVNFGSGGLTTFTARIGVPAAQAGGLVEVRTGSPTGPLAATLTVAATGGYTIKSEQSAAVITPLSGVQTVYLVFKGGWGLGNVDWFRFT